MERPDYDGVMFWGVNDWTFSENYNRAIEKLNSDQDLSNFTGINEIIELFEIYQILTCKELKEECKKPYLHKTKKLMSIVANFFKNMQDENLIPYYLAVCVHYVDDFWILFEKFSCYESISKEAMEKLLSREDFTLYLILEHSKICEAYDVVLADVLRQSDQTARMIVSEFLEEHNDRHKKLYFPKNMSAGEYEIILQKYVDSEYPNAGVLQLIWQSQSSSECPLSDQLRLNAKRKAQEIFSKLPGVTMSFSVGVSFVSIDDLLEVEMNENNKVLYKYSASFLENRLDNLSIIENFSTIFAFVDSLGRSRFPSIPSRLGVFERSMGIKGAKEYKTGHHFRVETLRTSAIMQEYYFFLKDKGINIENVISWFFSDYLREKYGLADWRFNASSENSRFAEKCKNLSSEMEAVLKQYKMYEETGAIDRELFEIASSHITFTSLSSLIRDKYAYINSKKLQKELNMLFSNQCMLLYVPDHKGYHDFASLVKTEKISIDDYNKNRKSDLDFLIKRNTIFVDELGNITPNDSRIMLLADLYDNDVLCLVYCDDFRDIIDELISEKEIVVENKLLTRPEIDYMNYMLNKSTFSNGWDLRNRYAHGTYSKNEDEQARDYFELLKIMIMVLLKIKEEFELKFGRSL